MSRLYAALAAIGGFLALLGAAFVKGRSRGAEKAENEAEELDNTRSKEIERKADAARGSIDSTPLDPVERLRKNNRLRD